MEPREDGRLADRDLRGGGGRVSAHTCLFLQPHLYLPPPTPRPGVTCTKPSPGWMQSAKPTGLGLSKRLWATEPYSLTQILSGDPRLWGRPLKGDRGAESILPSLYHPTRLSLRAQQGAPRELSLDQADSQLGKGLPGEWNLLNAASRIKFFFSF